MFSSCMTRVAANIPTVGSVIADSSDASVNCLTMNYFNKSLVIVLVFTIYAITITRGHPIPM